MADCKASINEAVATQIAKFAVPCKQQQQQQQSADWFNSANIVIVANMPKTRSGKVMRRLLRKIAQGKNDFGDTSTLLDPTVLDQLQIELAQQQWLPWLIK